MNAEMGSVPPSLVRAAYFIGKEKGVLISETLLAEQFLSQAEQGRSLDLADPREAVKSSILFIGKHAHAVPEHTELATVPVPCVTLLTALSNVPAPDVSEHFVHVLARHEPWDSLREAVEELIRRQSSSTAMRARMREVPATARFADIAGEPTVRFPLLSFTSLITTLLRSGTERDSEWEQALASAHELEMLVSRDVLDWLENSTDQAL